MSDGDSPEEAFINARQAVKEWVEDAAQRNGLSDVSRDDAPVSVRKVCLERRNRRRPAAIGVEHQRCIGVGVGGGFAYPYSEYGSYRIWPGPNSNTFVATVLRAAPELQVAMPPEAIGKDYRTDGSLAGFTESGTGVELSLYGLAGIKLGRVEGIEFNLLGLVAGLDIERPAVKIPAFGRIGLDRLATHPAIAQGRAAGK